MRRLVRKTKKVIFANLALLIILTVMSIGCDEKKDEIELQKPAVHLPPIIVGKDGAEMVLVPSGDFLMGSPEGVGEPDEHPQRTVYLDAFYIDKYEVTNAQYKKFMDTTGHRAPFHWNDELFNKPNQPVVGVTCVDAEAYCKWAGKRVPTEAEWEKAARGQDGRTYSWGDDEPNAGGVWRANYWIGDFGAADGFKDTAPVGSFPAGVSPYGAHDMTGNVGEWTKKYLLSSKPLDEICVVRGGSWATDRNKYLRVAFRKSGYGPGTNLGVGIRCVQNVSP